MLGGRNELTALSRIVAQPVQQLGETPLGRIHTAARAYRRQVHRMCDLGDPRCFRRRAMIAPEVVVIERNEILAEWNDSRPGRVERQRLDIGADNIRARQRATHRIDQRRHMRLV